MALQKIITCAGYYGTGSSAVTDLLGEFDNIFFMGDYEFRFVQDPGGIRDLDYNINENYHRHNSGHALKRFKKNVDFLSGSRFLKRYEAFFNNQFKRLSYEYINKLTLCTFKGYWHQDVIDRGMLFWIIERTLDKLLNRVVVRILRGGNNKEPISIHLLKNEITYIPINNSEMFYKATRDYMNDLFTEANRDNKEYIMVDQLVPPTNASYYSKYFDNIKIVVVDRDPRDLYILEKCVWKGGCVPVDSVESFCHWYSINRLHRKTEIIDTNKVLYVQFEDLIFKYDEIVRQIANFIGTDIEHHTAKKTLFKPEYSIKNTHLWEKHPNLIDEITFIEQNLPEYCVNY